jgi:hypothetical protein
MIRRYAENKVDLEKVRQDLENGLEEPELTENPVHFTGFSDLNFQIQYIEDGRYTAISEDYSINVRLEDSKLEVETAERKGEEFSTSSYIFHGEMAEMPERSIGSWSENPLDSALRSYARELYPEKRKSGKEEAWSMGVPPAEREGKK